MKLSVNKKYFEKLVHKMEMNYIKNKSSVFASYWAPIQEQNTTYNKYVSRKFLRNNRGVPGYIPEIKEFKYKGRAYSYLIDIAKQIFMRSLYYCPIDTGALKRSAYVKSDNMRYIDIGYSKDYAMYVHELLNNFHLRPTRAKFLEDAVMDVCNVNSKLWTLNDISIIVYISYDPLFVRITPKSLSGQYLSNDMEILFSNYDEVDKNMREDFDNNILKTDFINNEKLYYYRKYLAYKDDLVGLYLDENGLSKRVEDYKKGESLVDDYNNRLSMPAFSDIKENGVSIDGENYIKDLIGGQLLYNYDLFGEEGSDEDTYNKSGISDSFLERLDKVFYD
jgi:hypothetical protein